MATTSEDEEAKKQVKEAVWQITARGLVLGVAFGFGLFSGWIAWGVGIEGAPALREQTTAQEALIVELKNKQVDIEGQVEVYKGKFNICERSLQKVRTDLATARVALQKAEQATP